MRTLFLWVITLTVCGNSGVHNQGLNVRPTESAITLWQNASSNQPPSRPWTPIIRWYSKPGNMLVSVNGQVSGTLTLPNGSVRIVKRLLGEWFIRSEPLRTDCLIHGQTATAQTDQLAVWERMEEAAEEEVEDLLEAEPMLTPRPPLPNYEATLKPARLLLVLDKEATGPDTEENLAMVTAEQLAIVEHIGANYERQLGIRLDLQELILTPDTDTFEDIPNDDALNDFRDWVQTYRPIAEYGWTMASKRGAGLTGKTLGRAFIGRLGRETGISVVRTDAGWTSLAHELGHTLGAYHSRGGMMNATASAARSPSFYTDVSARKTAAMQIYERAADVLPTKIPLRHPEELPFAENDVVRVPPNLSSLHLNLLPNDLHEVRNGQRNETLTFIEHSALFPSKAGSLSLEEGRLRFTPSPTFTEQTAWFRYAIRGDVGNEGMGWPHAAQVTLTFEANVQPSDPDPNQPDPNIAVDEQASLQIHAVDKRLRIQLPQGQSPAGGAILEASPNLKPGSWTALAPVQIDGDTTWWVDLKAERASWFRLRWPKPE